MKKYDNKIIDINKTAWSLQEKCFDLLAVHALSGCDSVSNPFGKGKISVVNLLLKLNLNIRAFTKPNSKEEDWMNAGIKFLSQLYGGNEKDSLSDLRYSLFRKKKDPPMIKCLPPTDNSAKEHIKRARLQVLLWRAADQYEPPSITLSMYGWQLDEEIPVPVHGTVVAPKELLQLVACACKSCSRSNCSCKSAGISCTSYCKCEANENCFNIYTKETEHMIETDEESEDEQ